MKEYVGLDKMRSVSGNAVYCPKCGNYLIVVDNGWFHGELFYCENDKKIFAVQLLDITKKAGKKFLEQSQKEADYERIKKKITYKNMYEVEKVANT